MYDCFLDYDDIRSFRTIVSELGLVTYYVWIFFPWLSESNPMIIVVSVNVFEVDSQSFSSPLNVSEAWENMLLERAFR